MKTLILLLVIIIPSLALPQTGWYYLNPTPTGNNLYDLTMFSETSGICISTNSIFRTYDGGRNWTEYFLSNSDLYITGMSIVDSSLGYLSMGSGRILKTIDGGKTWSFVSQMSQMCYGIKFISSQTGYIFTKYNNLNYRGTRILKTTNAGISWTECFSDYSISLGKINFVTPSIGYSIGYNTDTNGNYYHTKILKTTNSGLTWDSIASSLNISPSKTLFLVEQTGFISGSGYNQANRILRTTNGGVSWGDTLKRNLVDIRFTDASSGYFITGDSTFARTTNAGANWTFSVIRNPTLDYNRHPNQLCFINQNTGVCVGNLGLILRTENNGTNWTNINSSFTNEEFDDVVFKNNNTGFLMGWDRNIYKTTNGSQNWTKYTFGNSNSNLGAMIYAGSNTWYLSQAWDPIMYKTTNDGVSWDTLTNTGFIQSTALKFLNPTTGFGVSKYNVFGKTTNGGLNWFINNQIGGQNWTLDFIDENTGFVGGGFQLRKTSNGGINFETIPESIIHSAWDVKFISRDTVVVSGISQNGVGTNRGAIWKSINGGTNWTEYLVPGAYALGPLRFTDKKTGYVLEGWDGSYYGLFKTTNAGENWFRIRVPDGRLVAINFADTTTGYIVGYDGLILKTTNGGASTFVHMNEAIPGNFTLFQNYPNPFNPSTVIKFNLIQSGKQTNIPVKIIIFDILGRQMETLLDEKLSVGVHEVNWNASKYAAGVYFYTLLTDEYKETKKMMLIK